MRSRPRRPLRYVCLFAYNNVQHILCCVFVFVFFFNYLCNQCLSTLMMWVRISFRARCTTLCDKVCQWLATGRWFSPGSPDFSTNKSDRHDIMKYCWKQRLNMFPTSIITRVIFSPTTSIVLSLKEKKLMIIEDKTPKLLTVINTDKAKKI
jgi:hypothetical protein